MKRPHKIKAGPNRSLTLVEMLVVMGICMVLSVLCAAAILKSRETARGVVCAGNLKNIGASFSLMLEPQKGYFTNSYYDIARLTEQYWWIGTRDRASPADPLVQASLGPSFVCPSAPEYMHTYALTAENGMATISTTYAYNVEMPIIARNVTRVPEPVNRILFYDGDPTAVVGRWEHVRDWPDRTIRPRHSGKANLLFLDGHVEQRGRFDAAPLHVCEWGFTTQPYSSGPLLDAGKEGSGLINPLLTGAVDVHQEKNNVKNNGNQLQCTIRIGGVEDVLIDLDSVYMLGILGHPFATPVKAEWPMHTSCDDDGVLGQLKFDRQTVYRQILAAGQGEGLVGMKVVGLLADGRPFEGVDPNYVFKIGE